jgi:hypothetical protein
MPSKLKKKELPIYSQKTIRALARSVKHWEENLKAKYVADLYIYTESCPLCKMFWKNHDEYYDKKGDEFIQCKGCPIRDYTGLHGCVDTPWERVNDIFYETKAPDSVSYYLRRAIRSEVKFLQQLLDKVSKDKEDDDYLKGKKIY